MEIAAKQDASAESRKALLEAVKGFKKLGDDEKLPAVNGLLKVFQDEVDGLTRRARFSEKAFLSLFKDFVEAPDPAPHMASAADSARQVTKLSEETAKLSASLAAAQSAASRGSSDQAAEVERLRGEVSQLEGELGKLQNQDITIRELEDRINDFEATIEAQVVARLAERESELRRIFDSELEAVREAEMAAEGRTASLRAALAEAAAQRDEAQAQASAMYEGGAGGGGSGSGGGGGGMRAGGGGGLSGGGGGGGGGMVPAAEADVLAADNERLASRVASLEAEVADARRRLAGSLAAASGSGSGDDSDAMLDPFSALRSQADAYRARADAAEEEVARLGGLLAQAQEDSRQWGAVLSSQRASSEAALAEASARLAARDAELAGVRAELASRPSVSEVAGLRHQLGLLRAMTFAGVAGDGDDDSGAGGRADGGSGDGAAPAAPGGPGADGSGSGGTGDLGSDVATVMLRRIRQLEGRLVAAEGARGDAQTEVGRLSAALLATRDRLSDSEELVARLEEELAAASSSSSSSSGSSSGGAAGGGGGAPATPAKGPAAATAVALLMSPESQLSSILGGGGGGAGARADHGEGSPPRVRFSLQPHSASDDPAPSSSGGSAGVPGPVLSFADGDASSMVAILRGQRDRFRARMLELEAEAQGRAGEVAEARTAASRLRGDNVKLYEKIRYLQSFLATGGGGGGGGGPGRAGGSDDDATVDVEGSGGSLASTFGLRARGAASSVGGSGGGGGGPGNDDDFEGPYKRMYAEAIDPFADFNRRERARQYSRLSTSERITLNGSQLLAASRLARRLLLAYGLVMHLLVFATLWHFAHVRHAGCGDVHDGEEDAMHHGGGEAVDRSPGFMRLLPTRFRGGAAAAAAADAAAVGGGASI